MNNFKPGDKIRIIMGDFFVYGEVTIVKGDECKVLFDEKYDFNYDYFPSKMLELVTEEDLKRSSNI